MSTHPTPPHPTSLPHSNSIKRPPPPHPLSPSHPPKIEQVLIRDFPEDGFFFRIFYRNLALLHLRVLLLPFIVLLQNKRTTSHLLRMLKIYIKRPASNKRARAVNRINTVYYFQISRNHILSGAKKFLSFRSSLGNLSRFEITRDSVLFSRKF